MGSPDDRPAAPTREGNTEGTKGALGAFLRAVLEHDTALARAPEGVPYARWFPSLSPASSRRWTPMITDDGSPTLAHAAGEPMHHSGGALSETRYVYGPLAEALARGVVPPRAVVVGLGLGYVEILTAATCAAHGLLPPAFPLTCESFESDDALVSAFHSSVRGARAEGNGDPAALDALCSLHDGIVAATSDMLQVDLDSVTAFLSRWEGNGLSLRAALSPAQLPVPGFGALFFDAYSSEVDSALWDEAFLATLLQRAAPTALFATYAARGSLKRVLRAHGFFLVARPGFAGKRECTLAWREQID